MTYDEARRYLLQRAQELGIDAEILTDEKRELTLGAFEGRLAETTQASQGGIGLRVVTRGKVGYASTEERSKDALEWALQEAVDNAELQSSTGGFLPEGQALGQNDLLSEGLSAPLEEKARKALELEQGLRSDPRLRQVALARYHETEQSVMLGSTRGALGGYRSG
ncbi:MAG TPA: DNA gyrase modulator, partial [Trueperaceae bacterium]